MQNNSKLKENLNNLGKLVLDKCIALAGIFTTMKESAALWKLASSRFTKGLGYIKKNCEIIDKIEDIVVEKVREFVRQKVEKQMNKQESRGVVFHCDSSLSKKIVKSNAIKKYVNVNRSKLYPLSNLQDTSLAFDITNPDLYNALHRADIIDAETDCDGTLCAKVIDTYDFNKNSNNPLVSWAGRHQEEGRIETYYSIIMIKIPQSVWSNYLQPNPKSSCARS